MNETTESLENLYRHNIAEEKRKREIVEKRLEDTKNENTRLREEVMRLMNIQTAERRRKCVAVKLCVSVAAAVAVFAAVKRHRR